MNEKMSLIATAVAIALLGSRAFADEARAVDVPAGELAVALDTLAQQSKARFMYSVEAVKGLKTEGVHGQLTAEQAIEALLKGTELKITRHPSGALLISSRDETSLLDRKSSIRLAQAETVSAGVETPEENQLSEIVVTAQKREQKLKDVPISMSVLSGSDMDKSTAQGVNEMLNQMPGVVVPQTDLQGMTQVAVRGVVAGQSYIGGASSVAYYLDSVPYGFVRNAQAPDANAYDLERVEVLRGPQGTLYGANAQAGVVRVLTHDADLDSFDLKARTTFSNTDRGGENYRADAAVNVPLIEDKLAARAVVSYADLSGWVDRPARNNLNDAQLRTYRLKLNAQPTDRLSLGLSTWRERDEFGGPATGNDAGRSLSTIPEPIIASYDASALTAGYQFSGFSVSSMTSYLDYEHDLTNDLISFVGSPLGLLVTQDSSVVAQELLLSSTGAGPWRWSGGAFYRKANDHWWQIVGTDSATILAWKDSSESYALFGEISRRFFNDRFEWTLGLRQFEDKVRTRKEVATPPPSELSDSFSATTPRVVLSWFPNRDLTAYVSYSEGFRSGMPQYYAITQSAPSIPAVKPDKLHNYEVGAKGNLFANRVTFDAAVFYIDWQDVQQTLSVPYPEKEGAYIGAQINGISASGVGFEVALTARPVDAVSVGASVGWNDLTFDEAVLSGGGTRFEKGSRLPGSSEYTAAAFANYTFAIRDWTAEISISGNYTTEQCVAGLSLGEILCGDSLLTARTAFAVRGADHWTASLYADNLTDEGGVAQPYITPEWSARPRPRTFGLQLEYRFK